jgi:hypothetical protein
MSNELETTESVNEAVPAQSATNAVGIASFVIGVISIFALAILTVPLAVVLGLIGLRHEQKLWAALGLVCAVIGFLTSPVLLGLLGLSFL